MTKLILRNTTREEARSLPSRFHTYIILRDGREIGRVKHSYRPKNAGGSAWQALLSETKTGPSHGMVSVYSKTLPKLCEIVRYVVTGEGEPPSHWR